jgi:hypothetical protein
VTPPRSTISAVIDMWNGSTTDGIDELLAPGYRGHMLGVAGGDRGADGYPDVIRRFRAANAGVTFRVVEQFDTSDRCVTRLEAHRPLTDAGPAVVSQGINISRFDDAGRLAEEWAIWSGWLDAPLIDAETGPTA